MSTCAAWTFGSIASVEGKLKPMPIEGAAARPYVAKASSWWGAQTFAIKGAIIGGLTTVLLVATIVPIAVAASNSGDAATAASTTLTLRVLNYTAACSGASDTLNWRYAYAAAGSANPTVPTWQGTLYIKDTANGCIKTPTVYAGWPMVTGQSMTAPATPAGYNTGFTMHNDTATGNLHLLYGTCVTYYYNMNTASAWWAGIDSTWKVALAADGVSSGVLPCVTA